MHTNKGLPRWSLLVAIATCFIVRAAELTVIPPSIVEAPPLTSRRAPLVSPGVGVAGTNAILVWNEIAGALPGSGADSRFPATNLVFSRVDQTGVLLDNPGRFLAERGGVGDSVTIVGAGSTFFMAYYDQTGLIATRVTTNGHPLFEPVIITTNSAATFRAVSNGDTLMVVFNSGRRGPAGLHYTLLDRGGVVNSKGSILDTESAPTFALATDGSDYLLVWQATVSPFIRATRFNGETAAYATVDVTTDNLAIAALGSGKNGYLLATRALNSTSPRALFHLDRDGFWINGGGPGPGFPVAGSVIYGEGEGWVIFSVDTPGELRSLRVTPLQPGLLTEPDPYPAVTGISSASHRVIPFGPATYLVARDSGVSVLSTSTASKLSAPNVYAIQNSARIVSSPFGYLVVWEEAGDISSLRALRFGKDGTRLDSHSFQLADKPTDPPSCVFDGSAYVVGWYEYGANSTRFARISPAGSPNAFPRTITLPDGPKPFGLVATSTGRVFLFVSEGASTDPALHVYSLSTAGDILGQNILHGESLVSDGANIYSVGSESGEVYIWRIVPSDIPQEMNRKIIAAGNAASGVSLRDAFALVWASSNSQWHYAYLTNGVIKFPSATTLPEKPVIAASDDHLLLAWHATANKNPVTFQSVHLATGQTSSTTVDFGAHKSLDLASAGKDFFGLTDSMKFQMNYIGRFWVTLAARPRFTLTTSNGFRTASLTLQPDRDYLIETSSDLVNWQFLQQVTGLSRFELPHPLGDLTFVRASLIPE